MSRKTQSRILLDDLDFDRGLNDGLDASGLVDTYKSILSQITNTTPFFNALPKNEDRYSGVFLPFNFPAYAESEKKVLFVGREPGGWNTKNNKNTLARIANCNENGTVDSIVREAACRYNWHLKDSPQGVMKTKHTSHFQRSYYQTALALSMSPDAMIYCNLFAWDYKGRSPMKGRPPQEKNAIIKLSLELLSAQVDFFKPDIIIFATGYQLIDTVIKKLFADHFNGHQTVNVIPRKLWEFSAGPIRCFRIAHPRAMQVEYMEEVRRRIS